jgi:uracil-DNA glycosylase
MGVSNSFLAIRLQPAVKVVVECRACPRLVAWREQQRHAVPPRFREWVGSHGFWARPLPAFGDLDGWLAIVGLAPAAQGANRTGRMFTGDRSGEFLFSALHRAGLASQPASVHRDDGLVLCGALITAALRCAPPGNRPERGELERCAPFLAGDLAAMRNLRVVLALGRIAHDAVLALLAGQGVTRPRPPFRHGGEHSLPGGVWLVDSFHPSQQNTFTGRLTAAMFNSTVQRCQSLAGGGGE